MNKEIFTRKELYDLVWTKSLVSLSKKYNISDNGLRKICIRMNIPLPANGHWTKLQFGKKAEIRPLPASYEGEQEVTLNLRTDEEKTDNGIHNPVAILVKEINNDPRLLIVVPAKLSSPDKLIVAAKERLTGKDTFSPFRYHGLVSCSNDELDIKVTPKNINRALRFMDTLIKGLRAREHDVLIKNSCTYAVIKKQELKICFREKLKKVVVDEHRGRSEYYPTDILYFKLDGYRGKEWKDGKHPLENYLPDIIAKLELESNRITEIQAYHRKRWEEREEQERLQRELQERKEKELLDFKSMLEKAERWHKAANLRNYIETAEKFAATKGDIPEEMKNRLEWARRKADWYDPFTEVEDEMLKEVDRARLSF